MIKLCFILIIVAVTPQILDNIPVTFQLKGPTTYTPDKALTLEKGYKLTVGFRSNSWIAVEFQGLLKNDVLLIQIDDYYTNSSNELLRGHKVTVNDYYYNSTHLLPDQDTSKDISSYSFSNTKEYSLDIVRGLYSINNGEDWNSVRGRYSVTKVCFYSSDSAFDSLTWRSFTSQCYYYEIDNLVSAFRGPLLKQFLFGGYQMSLYGWIGGPYLTANLYLHQATPLYTYKQSPAILIELGTTSANVGQDLYVCSPTALENGDYFGKGVTSMQKDNSVDGFENLGLTCSFWNANPNDYVDVASTHLRLFFSRSIVTFDRYDKQLLSTIFFCVYLFEGGSINGQVSTKGCQVVQLSEHYPRNSGN